MLPLKEKLAEKILDLYGNDLCIVRHLFTDRLANRSIYFLNPVCGSVCHPNHSHHRQAHT